MFFFLRGSTHHIVCKPTNRLSNTSKKIRTKETKYGWFVKLPSPLTKHLKTVRAPLDFSTRWEKLTSTIAAMRSGHDKNPCRRPSPLVKQLNHQWWRRTFKLGGPSWRKLKIPCVSTNERYWDHQNNPGYLPINERRLCNLLFRTMVELMEQNPAPVDMANIPLPTGFHRS